MKKKFILLFIIMLLIPLFYTFKVSGESSNNEDNKKVINVVYDENVDVKIYKVVDEENFEEINNEYKFDNKIKIKIEVSPKEGYRVAFWSYEYKKLSTGQNIHVLLKAKDLYSVIMEVGQTYTFYIYSVKEDNNCIVVLNYINSNVMKVEELSDGEKIKFPKTNGKGIGFYKAYTLEGDDNFVEYKNEGVDGDITTYARYEKETTTIGTIFSDYYMMFFKGLGKTLMFSVIAVFLALFLGTLVCLLKMSDVKIVNFIASAYIEIIRGVPLLLQLLIIYTVLPNMNFGTFFTTEVIACLLALFINSSAYVAEIFRSGIQAVDKGQTEAARALGLSKWRTLTKVVIPQGIKNCLPSIGNELIMVIKETSLASTVNVAIGELMSVQNQIKADSYIVLEPFFIIAIMYFIVTFTLSKVVRLIERRLESHD